MKVRLIARFKNETFFRARKIMGFSQARLAEEIGINTNKVAAWENFKGYPVKAWEIKLVEEILRASVDDLFPPEYKEAVDRKLGHTIHAVKEVLTLPDYMVAGLLQEPENPLKILERKEMREMVEEALTGLTEREAKVLIMRFGLKGEDAYSLRELAQYFDVCVERIRQIEDKALRKIRNPNFWHKKARKLIYSYRSD